MGLKRDNKKFRSIIQLAHLRAETVVRAVSVLMPNANYHQRRKVCNKILSLCDGKDRTRQISEDALASIVLSNFQCIAHNCPLLFFWEPMSRRLNEFFNEEE
jgi:hypothetical protein